jgi:hypothetical protein
MTPSSYFHIFVQSRAVPLVNFSVHVKEVVGEKSNCQLLDATGCKD